MTTNPFQPPRTAEGRALSPRWRTWAWVLVILGPLLAVGGVAAPVVVMMVSFHEVANSPSAPSPSDLAGNISTAILVAIVGIPAALLGVGLAIAGVVLLLVRPKPPGGDGTPR